MLKAEVVPAHVDHIDAIVSDVRQADIDELEASSGSTPEQALERGIKGSSWAVTVLYNGKPVAIAGLIVVNLLCGFGSPWMVATHAVEENPRPFLRLSRQYVAKMADQCPLLINFVDDRNSVAIRYLEWLGFSMANPQPFGKSGLPFRRFEMRSQHV